MATSKDPTGWVYDIVLSQRDRRYFLRIPELNLIVDDYDLTAAYARLETAKQDLFARSATLGIAVSPPRDLTLKREFWASTLPFSPRPRQSPSLAGSFSYPPGFSSTRRSPSRCATRRRRRAGRPCSRSFAVWKTWRDAT